MTAATELVQANLETLALENGRARYLKKLQRDYEDGNVFSIGSFSDLVKGSLKDVSRELEAQVSAQDNKGKGRTPFAVSALKALDFDLVALAGLTKTFECVCLQQTVPFITRAIARQIELEAVVVELDQRDREVQKGKRAKTTKSAKVRDQLKKRHTNPRRRVETADKVRVLKDEMGWDDREQTLVGTLVLNAVLVGAKAVFERYTLNRKGEVTHHVGLTHEALAYVARSNELAQWMSPSYMPMVVPPRDWKTFTTGAYQSREVSRTVKLVRTFDKAHRKLVEEGIASGGMSPCLDALNAIQGVPLRVNGTILELVEWAYRTGSISGLPRNAPHPIPPRPEAWEFLEEEERREWKAKAREAHARNRELASEIATLKLDLDTAKRLQGQDVYLPHNLDFRGRVYPVPFFSHHRADHVRSMLEFARGKRIGDEGIFWLAVHLANQGDFGKVSKASFDDRVQWVQDHQDQILAVALDPQGTVEFWSQADCPFGFVAACLEWAGVCAEGADFVSHLPIGLDGSNSGLQHYSAILRDEEGGALVNLLPQEKPQDVYAAVAKVTRELVQLDLASGLDQERIDLGLRWLAHGIDRKVVKRNVMTFAYSSEKYGFGQQLLEDLIRPLQKRQEETGEVSPFDGVEAKAAHYLAQFVWDAVNTVVRRAGEGMRWFQSVAASLAHQGQPVTWTTPVGLPVIHRYSEYETATVNLYLYDREVPVVEATEADKVVGDNVFSRVQANIRTRATERVKKSKQKSAVAPNVIHSLDAAHLMKVVNRAKAEGIEDVLLIHDSFATHASEAGRWSEIIRDEFAGMYETFDPFQEIARTASEHLAEVPQAPERGALDLNETRKAIYAFA